MIDVKQYTDLEYAIMTLQDHGLFVNEHKLNGMQDVLIDTYLEIVDYSIGILKMLQEEVDIKGDVYRRQEEQIDALLSFINEMEKEKEYE